MKTIGLIGGTSWESTVPYYRLINEAVRTKLGGLHSAKLLLYSVDFAEVEREMSAGNWERCAEILTDAALRLERGGADFLVICTNTLHKVVPLMEQRISLPILHIADVTADALAYYSMHTVGFLGTRFAMEQDFIRNRLTQRGVRVLTPFGADASEIDRIIFEELCVGIFQESSRQELLRIIDSLHSRGAEGIILGCTEIGLLIQQDDTDVPLLDTTEIHARRAAQLALEDSD